MPDKQKDAIMRAGTLSDQLSQEMSFRRACFEASGRKPILLIVNPDQRLEQPSDIVARTLGQIDSLAEYFEERDLHIGALIERDRKFATQLEWLSDKATVIRGYGANPWLMAECHDLLGTCLTCGNVIDTSHNLLSELILKSGADTIFVAGIETHLSVLQLVNSLSGAKILKRIQPVDIAVYEPGCAVSADDNFQFVNQHIGLWLMSKCATICDDYSL